MGGLSICAVITITVVILDDFVIVEVSRSLPRPPTISRPNLINDDLNRFLSKIPDSCSSIPLPTTSSKSTHYRDNRLQSVDNGCECTCPKTTKSRCLLAAGCDEPEFECFCSFEVLTNQHRIAWMPYTDAWGLILEKETERINQLDTTQINIVDLLQPYRHFKRQEQNQTNSSRKLPEIPTQMYFLNVVTKN